MSGYILFSSEMRAVIKAQHPDFSFGELSRLVGTEWRNLDSSRKAEYEGEYFYLMFLLNSYHRDRLNDKVDTLHSYLFCVRASS